MTKRTRAPKGPQQGPPPAIFSFGGGVQSMACLVLAAKGQIPYRYFIFADVGDDSEDADTVAYIERVAKPYAAQHGLRLLTVRKLKKDGTFESILQKLHRTQTSIDIPVRMQNGAPGNRSCTADYKIKPVAKWMKDHGATVENPGEVAVGISLDEWTRMKPSQIPYLTNVYPLVDRGISRDDCLKLIADAGVELPPKSSCWFCPFHRPSAWLEQREKKPEVFAQSVQLEAMINERRASLGLDDVFFTRFAIPLDQAIDKYVADLQAKADAAAAKERRRLPNGKLVPVGYEVLKLFDFDALNDGQHNCGPFTCDGGGSADQDDPTAGLVTRKLA